MKVDRDDRVQWLRQHPEVWNLSRPELVGYMKQVGLLSKKTYWKDVNLYNLLREAGAPRRVADKFSARNYFPAELRG